jgi:hypothetical protein
MRHSFFSFRHISYQVQTIPSLIQHKLAQSNIDSGQRRRNESEARKALRESK